MTKAISHFGWRETGQKKDCSELLMILTPRG